MPGRKYPFCRSCAPASWHPLRQPKFPFLAFLGGETFLGDFGRSITFGSADCHHYETTWADYAETLP